MLRGFVTLPGGEIACGETVMIGELCPSDGTDELMEWLTLSVVFVKRAYAPLAKLELPGANCIIPS